MTKISKQKVEQLAKFSGEICISIYLPLSNTANKSENKIRFKNHIQQVRHQLQGLNLKEKNILQYIQPLVDLLSDENLWRTHANSFAVFGIKNEAKHFFLPFHVNSIGLVSHQFYLLPLIDTLSNETSFYLLRLSLKGAELFEGDRNELKKVPISEKLPESIEQIVGEDVEQKTLQYRSGATATGQRMYHGHGEGKDDKKTEIIKYLQAVEGMVTTYLNDFDAPLVIAGVDYISALYSDINSYPHLFHKNISGNTEGQSEAELHQSAWEIIKGHFAKEIETSKQRYLELINKNKASRELDEVIRAANLGMVRTLFVEKGKVILGTYEDEDQKIHLKADDTNLETECLLDKSAKQTFRNGGRVFWVDKEELPEPDSPVNAVFRY